MPRTADHEQSAHIHHAGAQLDVGTTARHVGGHRDRAFLTGPGHDLGLVLMVFGVEHVVRNVNPFEHAAQNFGIFNRDGAQQHRLPLLVPSDHLIHDSVELLAAGLEY
ncbi:hypothetical protein SDC9_131679 [bioreactor metagenome]|uniref:Uncharacterized protein n=1 Tax=bioreactor metagenome TaxID=1076179 RepID=A0A645D5F6_9ZZZZ